MEERDSSGHGFEEICLEQDDTDDEMTRMMTMMVRKENGNTYFNRSVLTRWKLCADN